MEKNRNSWEILYSDLVDLPPSNSDKFELTKLQLKSCISMFFPMNNSKAVLLYINPLLTKNQKFDNFQDYNEYFDNYFENNELYYQLFIYDIKL